MVRHEAAEALGAIADARCNALLQVRSPQLQRATGACWMSLHAHCACLRGRASCLCCAWAKRSRCAVQEHCSDAEPIVAQSCLVALDMLAYEASGDFEYADVGLAGV